MNERLFEKILKEYDKINFSTPEEDSQRDEVDSHVQNAINELRIAYKLSKKDSFFANITSECLRLLGVRVI